MNFKALVHAIADIHRRTQSTAARSVNIALTCRNWLIGAYIHEYELQGQDRAEYGEQLIKRLADALRKQRVPACERPRLYAYLSFYRIYPQISEAVSREWDSMEISTSDTGEIFRSPLSNDLSPLWASARPQFHEPVTRGQEM